MENKKATLTWFKFEIKIYNLHSNQCIHLLIYISYIIEILKLLFSQFILLIHSIISLLWYYSVYKIYIY